MAKMKKCATCGADIASSAKACPKCGAKNKKPFYKNPLLLVVVLVIAVVAFNSLRYPLSGCGTITVSKSTAPLESTGTTEYEDESIETTSKDILADYEKNSITTKETYLGQRATVKMKISSISQDSIADYKGKIWVNLSSSSYNDLKSLTKDDCVIVQGTISDIISLTWVELSDGVIIETVS